MEPWRFVRQAPMLLTDVAALTVVAGIACTVMLLGHLLVARGEAAIRAKPGSVPGSGVSDGGVSVPDVRGPSRCSSR